MIVLLFAALTLAALAVLPVPLWRAQAEERHAARPAAVVIALTLAAGAASLYAGLGEPALSDRPYAQRTKDPAFALQSEAFALAKRLHAAPNAAGFARLGEILTELAGGRVSPAAGEAFARALELDGENPAARYYAGLALMQRHQPGAALKVWRALEKDSRQGAPWLPLLEKSIELAETAGK
jgi:hypothetical protein